MFLNAIFSTDIYLATSNGYLRRSTKRPGYYCQMSCLRDCPNSRASFWVVAPSFYVPFVLSGPFHINLFVPNSRGGSTFWGRQDTPFWTRCPSKTLPLPTSTMRMVPSSWRVEKGPTHGSHQQCNKNWRYEGRVLGIKDLPSRCLTVRPWTYTISKGRDRLLSIIFQGRVVKLSGT